MRKKEPVTLTDVAAAASVSQSTVSRVLSRYPRVNGNTRKRVLDTIAKLGYDTSAIQRKQAARNSKATDRKSTRLNSSHVALSRMPSSA